jgi:hypothetical protein
VSAGKTGIYPGEPPLVVHRELGLLAPKMRAAVGFFLAECLTQGLDAMVEESYRSHETAVAYYNRGRTQIPPTEIVTHAPNELYSWHGFGLAVDVISRAKGWDPGTSWFAHMASIAKAHGLKWGGDWTQRDLPHVQWGPCKASPSDQARALFKEGGLVAVWNAVGAI